MIGGSKSLERQVLCAFSRAGASNVWLTDQMCLRVEQPNVPLGEQSTGCTQFEATQLWHCADAQWRRDIPPPPPGPGYIAHCCDLNMSMHTECCLRFDGTCKQAVWGSGVDASRVGCGHVAHMNAPTGLALPVECIFRSPLLPMRPAWQDTGRAVFGCECLWSSLASQGRRPWG